MFNKLLTRLFFLSCLVFAANIVKAQAPVFNSATPNSANIAKFDKFEVNIDLTAAYANAFDYDDIAVTATFTAPGGRVDVVDGFFMQDYTIGGNGFALPVGSGSFRVRYSPNETGTWSYVISCTNASGTTTMPAATFNCQASVAPGFIRKNATNYLAFDNGSQYIPIGENMGWQSNNVVNNYTDWVNDLAGNGGTFIRVWMSSWAFALEWKNASNNFQGLKKYKQSNAFYLDWLLDYCRQKNVYMMLTLNNHGQVSTNVNPEWNDNPYNAANGGPATNTWDFFTNATAKALHKNRLRYIIARYGYSQNIQSWELFNELHWTNDFENRKADLTAWDNEMSTYIKGKDVYKHLVTTSYGGTEVVTNTWSLPNIDFTQTHFYVNSPNIETVLAGANQSFLSQYSKPTLNGEFGLGPAGNTLSANDPNGVHIHNAIWGSMFSGGLGSGMTWWWDDYIEPQNLYYHYKPLSSVVSLISFKNDNYKKVTTSVSGGGASDLSVSPGGGFAKPAASNFTIDAAGTITPSASALSQYMFGSTYNTQNRNPPTFTITFPTAGQFKVVVSGVSASSPKVTIYLDGLMVLNQDAISGNTYSINVPTGQHSIKVDNLGIDWFSISNYIFTNVGSPVTAYVLKGEANNKAAGYLLNNKYNWQYLKNNSNVAPPAVSGSSLSIPGMINGNYTVFFYSASTGEQLSTLPITVSNGTLNVAIPDVAWDLAFRAAENSTLPIKLRSFTGVKAGNKNRLYMDIASAENVKTVYLERSANPNDFTVLHDLGAQWNAIAGKHEYVDNAPLNGTNYYRLKIVDVDGKQTFSGVVRLVNDAAKFSVQPNPFTNMISVQLQRGKYTIRLVDQSGKTVLNKPAEADGQQTIQLETARLKPGIYYAVVYNEAGKSIGSEKIIK